MGMTRWVMRFAPIGVFALAALLVHFVVVMPLSLKFVAQANPWRLYKIMMPALLTAFSTVPIKV